MTFITIFGLSVVVWFFHSVARGLSTQPSPEIEQKRHYITLNSKNQVKVAKYQKGFSFFLVFLKSPCAGRKVFLLLNL